MVAGRQGELLARVADGDLGEDLLRAALGDDADGEDGRSAGGVVDEDGTARLGLGHRDAAEGEGEQHARIGNARTRARMVNPFGWEW